VPKHASHNLDIARKGAEHLYDELKAEIASLVKNFPHLAATVTTRVSRAVATDDKGNLKPFGEVTEEQGAALARFKVIIKHAEAGDGEDRPDHKMRFWDRMRALEMLATHFALLNYGGFALRERAVTWRSRSDKRLSRDRARIRAVDWNTYVAFIAERSIPSCR